MKNPKLILIDFSSLIYVACSVVSNKEDVSDDFSKYKETLDFYLDNILSKLEADKYLIFGDASSSYRKKLFTTFKADRKKPYMKFKYDLQEYAKTSLGMFIHNELEADDLCLLANRKLSKDYEVIIASIDSDLRQDEATFFNYGIFKKSDYKLEDGFEVINEKVALFNLWEQALVKGHNNKLDYLEKCGEGTAKAYLSAWQPSQYKYAVLKAFIEGINKDEFTDVKRNINGYGLNKGIDKFNKSFKQTYLFRYEYELEELGIELEYPELQTYNKLIF